MYRQTGNSIGRPELQEESPSTPMDSNRGFAVQRGGYSSRLEVAKAIDVLTC